MSESWERYEIYGDCSRSERLRLLLADAVVTQKRLLTLRAELQQEVPEMTDLVFEAIVKGRVSFEVVDSVNEV